jgi:hypothetical protein
MNRSLLPLSAMLIAAVWAVLASAHPAFAASAPADPIAQFDRGVELLSKDPFASRTPLAKAAAGFEAMLSQPLSQNDRARVLYNVGVARQLGGDVGPAVVAFRRADLLMPALSGLAEHLASARATARGEPPPSPHELRKHEVDFEALAREWTLSIPRVWLWRSALGAYVVFWSLLLVRPLVRSTSWRPPFSLTLAVAFLGLVPATILAADLERDRHARSEAVVMTESVTRLQPDDLVGQPSPAGTLKPGAEVRILEQRTGGNGQTWLRVRPLGSPEAEEESAAWIPGPNVERVIAPPA